MLESFAALQLRRISASLSVVAVRFVGARRAVAGLAVVADAGPAVLPRIARNSNVYPLKFVRPVTVCDVVFRSLPEIAVQSGFHAFDVLNRWRYW